MAVLHAHIGPVLATGIIFPLPGYELNAPPIFDHGCPLIGAARLQSTHRFDLAFGGQHERRPKGRGVIHAVTPDSKDAAIRAAHDFNDLFMGLGFFLQTLDLWAQEGKLIPPVNGCRLLSYIRSRKEHNATYAVEALRHNGEFKLETHELNAVTGWPQDTYVLEVEPSSSSV
jgi:hypothetical protein